MKARVSDYPGISEILARKARGRKQLAALRFEEKLDILDSMRARTEPIRRARVVRKRRRPVA